MRRKVWIVFLGGGGKIGSGGTRDALGSTPGALQPPTRHLYHLRPLIEKGHPAIDGWAAGAISVARVAARVAAVR